MIETKKYHLWVLGCQMNYADSQKIAGIFDDLGFSQASKIDEADVVVVVACSIRQAAVDRILGRSKNWQKRRGKNLTTILTGCVMEQDHNKMEFLFDYIIPIAEIDRLKEIFFGASGEKLAAMASKENSFAALVPIMTGCNNFCSYCVVPYTRGREQSRLADEIIEQCQKLIQAGVKEITLLGQNVNSYHDGNIDFSKLLSAINKIEGDYWIKFYTSHPKDLSSSLIEVMATGGHIAPCLHLAVQSGDDEILQLMNRKYTAEHYLELVEVIRKKIPEIAISTDVIVGFPGETEQRFENTLALMRVAKFDMAYLSQYSPRPQTAASKMTDNVPKLEKKKREELVNEILKATSLEHNQKYLHQSVKVLVDGFKKGQCHGRTFSNKNVIFAGEENLVGNFVEVKIIEAGSWVLKGKK